MALAAAPLPAGAQVVPPAPASPQPSPTPAAAATPAPTPPPTPAAVPSPPPPPRTGCDPVAGDICLNAEKQEQVDAGHYHAEGFVDLQAGTSRIQADQLDMYETPGADGKTSRRVVASGNVVFMHGTERLSGDKLEMDLGSSTGLFENAHGFVSPGVLIEAGKIRRVSADTYEVEDAHFTSCTQPTPRWSFSASSATLKIDDHIRGKHVVFRVKDKPAFYFPYFIYPIEDDQRSSGILFPHFGQSDQRGYNIGTGFFWAMNRSFDQTFYVDTFTKSGFGLGHELRYALTSPSRGNFRTYGFRRAAVVDAAGAPVSRSAWEHDFNWNAVQTLPGKWLANLNVHESSTLDFQEEFQENLDLASRRNRRSSASLQRSYGPLNVQAYADSVDTFFGSDQVFDRRRHLPALVLNHASRKLGGSGLVFAFESRAERLAFGNQDEVNQYSRVDLFPRLSRPMSVSFLQVTPQIQARATRYGATATDEGFIAESIDRRYLESSVESRGPTFSRVFENKGGFYSDRYKHVIGPEVTWTYRSKIDEFESIPRFDYLDQILGTNEVHYALVQRLYAKRPGASGKPEAYEFFNWRLAQTYYVDIAEGQNEFDPNYSSAVFGPDGTPAHYSPLQSRMRLRPTPRLQSNFSLEYDVNFRMMRTLDLSVDSSHDLAQFQLGWSRSKRIAVNPENRVLQRDTVRGRTRFQAIPRRLSVEGSLDYDLLAKSLVQATARMRYDVQCCGLVAEMIQYNYNTRQERQFRFGIELANIGTIGNFMGADANSGFLGRR